MEFTLITNGLVMDGRQSGASPADILIERDTIKAVTAPGLSGPPEARIIDISHHIPPHNLTQAAFILKNCYRDFPPGTIHIIGVSTEESEMSPHTVVLADGQYFIGADNGIDQFR